MQRFKLLFLFILIANTAFAQILLVDRELMEDSVPRKNWYLLVTADFSSDKQKGNLDDLESYLEYARFLKSNYIMVANFELSGLTYGPNIIQNEGFGQIRLRDNDKRRHSAEAFLQYQWNGSWGMVSRKIAGGNYRYKVVDIEGFDCYLGFGLFYQSEEWNWNGVSPEKLPVVHTDVIENKWRLNQYLKISKRLTKSLDVSSMNYFQSNLDLAQNPHLRWYLYAQLMYTINTHFQFGFTWDHVYDFAPIVPIDNYYKGYNSKIMWVF